MKINLLRHKENSFLAPTCLSRAVIFELLIGTVQTITMGLMSGLMRTLQKAQIAYIVFERLHSTFS